MSVGILLADTIGKWHDPERVIEYFKAFGFTMNFYSNDDVENLKCLWQIRHSIVHTAATVTKPDAQKIPCLTSFAGRNIVFSNKFMYELMRHMNTLVREANLRLEREFLSKLSSNVTNEKRIELQEFLSV